MSHCSCRTVDLQRFISYIRRTCLTLNNNNNSFTDCTHYRPTIEGLAALGALPRIHLHKHAHTYANTHRSRTRTGLDTDTESETDTFYPCTIIIPFAPPTSPQRRSNYSPNVSTPHSVCPSPRSLVRSFTPSLPYIAYPLSFRSIESTYAPLSRRL